MENQLVAAAAVLLFVLRLVWCVNVSFTLSRIERNTRGRR